MASSATLAVLESGSAGSLFARLCSAASVQAVACSPLVASDRCYTAPAGGGAVQGIARGSGCYGKYVFLLALR